MTFDEHKFSNSDIVGWEQLGSRAVYGLTLRELARENKSVIALSADLIKSSGLDRMSRDLPSQTINVGISEQNLIGVASGMAAAGLIPFVSSFAPFLTQRANEQIRMNLGYMECNVKLVGLGSGLAMGFLGNSHYGTEDIAVLRSIPNLHIYSPADAASLVKIMNQVVLSTEPVYIRLTGIPGYRRVYDEIPELKLSGVNLLRLGQDAVVFATGTMVRQALDCSEILKSQGIHISVIDTFKIKPLQPNIVSSFLTSQSPVITIEEHSIIGGLGSVVAEILSEQGYPSGHLRIGLQDSYGLTSDYQSLLEVHGLTATKLANSISVFLEQENEL